MNDFDFIEDYFRKIGEFQRQIMSDYESKLCDIIQNYDFVVGSMASKDMLRQYLPADANIVYTPYIEPTQIIAVKKFNIMDLCKEGEV